jgi:hypothetical protein
MNKNALHRIIGSVILPRYPWIEGYSIELYLDAPMEKYTIYYYIKPEDDGDFTVTEEMNEVEKMTEDLFRIIGPDRHQVLQEVLFLVKNSQQDY